MVQLKILSGQKAGTAWEARHFPVRIGRSAESDLQLEEPGVWGDHFQIVLNPGAGYVLETFPNALMTANGQPVESAVLRNGDLLEIGSLKIQFWLSEAPQRALWFREAVVWTILAGVCLGQIALIYWLVR
jgi:predicted component of type VI protein secretion system